MSSLSRFLLVVAGLLITVLFGLSALVFGLRVAYDGQALPGTRVAGVALGGASAEEARRRLAPVAGADVPVVLRAADKTYRIRPADAGYAVDLDATVRAALDAGRDGLLGGALATVGGVVRTRDVELVTRVDRARFAQIVDDLTDEIDRAPFPGALEVTTNPIAVGTVPPRTGRKVDRAVLARLLERAIRRRGGASVSVPVILAPVARRDAVEAVAREAEDYLLEPLRLTGAGDPWRSARRSSRASSRSSRSTVGAACASARVTSAWTRSSPSWPPLVTGPRATLASPRRAPPPSSTPRVMCRGVRARRRSPSGTVVRAARCVAQTPPRRSRRRSATAATRRAFRCAASLPPSPAAPPSTWTR